MIRFLRHRKIQRNIIIVAAALIIPSFVFFGISLDGMDGNALAGRIGNEKIKITEFIRHYKALSRELELFHGITRAQTAGADYEELTWQRILLVHAAEERNLTIENKELVQWLQSQPVFMNDQGQFDKERYYLLLEKRYGVTPKSFESDLKEFLMLRKVRDVFREEVMVSEAEIREEFRKTYAPRSFDYVLINKESLKEPVSVTEEELKQYYDWMKDGLFHPASVRVEIASFEGAASDAPNAEETLESSGQTTPFFAQGDAVPGVGFAEPLNTAAFGLAEAGDVTDWIEHNGKAYAIRLIEKKNSSPMSLDDASNILTEKLTRLKERKILMKTADDFAANAKASSFENAAEEAGFGAGKIENWTDGTYIDGAGNVESLQQTLKEVDLNGISDPAVYSKGFLVARVNAIGIVDESLWDEKKEELKLQLRFRKEVELYEKTMKDLRLSLRVNQESMKKLFPSKYEALEQAANAMPGGKPLPIKSN